MSSKELNIISISIKQYKYKLKAYSTLFYGLFLAQIIALFFSFGGISYMSSGNGELSVSLNVYSSNLVIVFSLLWILFASIQLTTKNYKRIETPLVKNNLTGNLSDVGFLITASIYGGVTASLAGVLLRVMMYFSFDRSYITFENFFIPPYDLLLGIIVAMLYMILVSAISYLAGMLIKISTAFVIGIPTVAIGISRAYTDCFRSVLAAFTEESSLLLFMIKVIITSFILFGMSILLSNRRELSQ